MASGGRGAAPGNAPIVCQSQMGQHPKNAHVVSVLQLANGNCLHCWHLITDFALMQKYVVTGANESDSNTNIF